MVQYFELVAGIRVFRCLRRHLAAVGGVARPELAGTSWRAVGVSLVFHPRKSVSATTHANVRHFRAMRGGDTVAWWFGGSRLTRSIRLMNVLHWHQTAHTLCEPFSGDQRYDAHKRWCDSTSQQASQRKPVAWAACFSTICILTSTPTLPICAVGDGFLDAYLPIVERRSTPGKRERRFSCTGAGVMSGSIWCSIAALFGLQSGGRSGDLMGTAPLVR